MKLTHNIRSSITIVTLCISILAWIVLLVNPGKILGVSHCHSSVLHSYTLPLQISLAMKSITSMLTGWGLMVIAMMLPKLIFPIRHIYFHSIKRYRLVLAFIFVFGYIGVWMVIGFFTIAFTIWFQMLFSNSSLSIIIIAIVTLVWQLSPTKQLCLNRGHNHKTINAFGLTAGRDALLFGVTHGFWCVGAGWALMLFPMVLPVGHNLAMIVVTFIMLSEHLEKPQIPRWQLHFRAKLLRFLSAQIQSKVKKYST